MHEKYIPTRCCLAPKKLETHERKAAKVGHFEEANKSVKAKTMGMLGSR